MTRTAMRRTLAIVLGCWTAAAAAPAFGQTVFSQFPAPGQSYVISSSPTSDGGQFTTTYTPPRSSSVGSTLPGTVGAYGSTSAGTLQYRPVTDAYGYPVASSAPANPIRGSVSQTFYGPAPASGSSSFGSSTGQVAAANYNGGIDPRYGRAVVQTNYQVPVTNVPASSLPSSGVPASSAPTYGSTVPSTGWSTTSGMNPYVGAPVRTVSNSGVAPVGYQTVGYPQTLTNCNSPANLPPSLGYGNYGSVPSTVPVNGNYKPLLPIQGLPAGTYVSQGLIGQPKAFVNGQPVRNVFRYILP